MPSADSTNPRRILIVAAETSSCLYAQRLLEHWKKHNVSVDAFGIGNQAMIDLGFRALARAEELAVVGVQEVIAHWPVIKKAFYDVLAAVEAERPPVVLLLDYPDFNLRLAKKLKAAGVPVVYYLSPQVWAWRRGRVNLIRRVIDKMLVVFPFEVDFYQGRGVNVEFVGHPLLDELAAPTPAARAVHRAKYGLADDDVLLGLMPGSRRGEIKHHLTTQFQTARRLIKAYPRLRVALLVAPNFDLAVARAWLEDLDFPLLLIKDEPFSMIDLADVVLCASGTATLMVGLLEKPMVIMYKMNRLTAVLAKTFVRHTEHFGLINLVLGERAVPELFQEQAEPERLARELAPLIEDSGARSRVRAKLAGARDRLGTKGATAKVARALETYWSR